MLRRLLLVATIAAVLCSCRLRDRVRLPERVVGPAHGVGHRWCAHRGPVIDREAQPDGDAREHPDRAADGGAQPRTDDRADP